MKTIDTYKEIRNTYPQMKKCFFAFGKEQFERDRRFAGIGDDEKIVAYGCGLYGTKEGVDQYIADIDTINARIPKECDPQDVYDYEFTNHECGYTCNDADAIKLVVRFFGVEVARKITRRYGYTEI